MTTESELYKSIGVRGYSSLECWRKDGTFHLRLAAPASCYRCPQCGNRDVIRRGTVDRIVHAPRIGMDRTLLLIQTPRLECRRCERVLNAVLPNVVPKCNDTKSFARIVIDWITGAIVFVGEGKGQNALNRFWKRLRGSKAKIKAVATDMSSAYYAAVIKNLPNAKQVFDRFHIVKLMNDKLTQLRRELQREAEVMDKKVLKGLRWLLLKHPENLDESKNERIRLQEALDLNKSLATAYYLKEDLSQIWQQSTKALAAKFLTDWCRRARATGIKVLITMANTLEGHRNGILNWYDYPISTGPLEGINNKIGALQRMAFGYKDKDYFIAKLYALHLAKFALIG